MLRILFHWLNYLIFFAASVFLFLFYHNYYLLILLVVLIIFPVFSMLSMRYAVHRMKLVMVSNPNPVSKNETVPLTFLIKNPSIYPVFDASVSITLSNFYKDSEEKKTISVPLMPKKDNSFTISFTSAASGCIQAKLSKVSCTDLLHLWRSEVSVKELAFSNFMILPSMIEETDIMDTCQGFKEEDQESSRKGMQSVPTETADIRDYISGDSLRQVHWKISAKKEKLMVKEFVTVSSGNVILLVERNKTEGDEIQTVLDLLYTTAQELIRQGKPHCLCWWSEEEEEIKECFVSSEMDLQEALFCMFCERLSTDAGKAFHMAEGLWEQGTFFYFCPYSQDLCLPEGELLYQYKEQAQLIQFRSW